MISIAPTTDSSAAEVRLYLRHGDGGSAEPLTVAGMHDLVAALGDAVKELECLTLLAPPMVVHLARPIRDTQQGEERADLRRIRARKIFHLLTNHLLMEPTPSVLVSLFKTQPVADGHRQCPETASRGLLRGGKAAHLAHCNVG